MNNLDFQLENKIKELIKALILSKSSLSEKEADKDINKLLNVFKEHEAYELLKELDDNEKREYISKFQNQINKLKSKMPRKIKIEKR